MPFKRPAPLQQSSSRSESNTPDVRRPAKRTKVEDSAKVLADIKVHIVQVKIDGQGLSELIKLAEDHSECLVEAVEDADVVITAISMRRRFERHVPWNIAKTKAIVTPAWLRDSVAEGKALSCEHYVALQDLREETIKNCPTCDKKPCECADTEMEEAVSERSSFSPDFSSSSLTAPTDDDCSTSALSPKASSKKRTISSGRYLLPDHLMPPSPPIPTDVSRLNHASRYACQRASPLICSNQSLVTELDIIKRSRALEGEDRSTLSYSRAISIIKAYPDRITSTHKISELTHIGAKITGLIQEYLDRGTISEARTIAASDRFNTLTLFSSIYGIGPQTARRLYALGLRTVEELEIYYGIESEGDESQLVEIEHRENFKDGEVGLGETWIRIALGLRKDLELKIPRDEVEETGRAVMHEMEKIQSGCVSTIVGGYRRGKPESNDVDIVITHPDPNKSKGLCKKFIRHLHARGMVTHVMHLSGFHSHNPLKTSNWDSLEKALTIFILPSTSPLYKGTRRRLDLIFAQPEVYWCAVVGWSGSIMFERDLRLWANDKANMKFDSSGITRRYDSKPFYPKTEKEVFDLFDLEWIDPIWRNADL